MKIRVCAVTLCCSLLSLAAAAATITVDSTADVGSPGRCTLRDAITAANEDRAENGCPAGTPGADLIAFAIPAGELTQGVAIIEPATLLPAVVDTLTIDGTTQTKNIGNTNPVVLGAGGRVGLGADGLPDSGDELSLPRVAGPEVEIRGRRTLRSGLNLFAPGITVRGLSVWGFGQASPPPGETSFQADLYANTATGLRIEGNVIGSPARGFADPGSERRSANFGLHAANCPQGTLEGNLIGFHGGTGALVTGGVSDGWTVRGNEIRSNGSLFLYTDAETPPSYTGDGLGLEASSNGSTVEGNLIAGNFAAGLSLISADGDDQVRNNTFVANGQGGFEKMGIDIRGSGNTVQLNVFRDHPGQAVTVSGNGPRFGYAVNHHNRISRNSMAGSKRVGIDLVIPATHPSAAEGATENSGAYDPDYGNDRMNYPVITSYELVDGTLTASGFVGSASGQAVFAGVTVEIFVAAPPAAESGGAEGYAYLGSCLTGATGDFSCSLAVAGTALALLRANGGLAATATDAAGNTSEFGTQFSVQLEVVTVPTLSTWSMLILSLVLGAVGWRRLRAL